MLESTNSSKVARLVDSLDNYDDYQYDYDTLHFKVGQTGDWRKDVELMLINENFEALLISKCFREPRK